MDPTTHAHDGGMRKPHGQNGPRHYPAAIAGLTQISPKTRRPGAALATPGQKTWRRPTLARPCVLLPSAVQGLTAVFGMGTGGTPDLWSPGK